MRIKGFEWDDGNILHLELRHGIEPYEAEEVFANQPIFRKTRKDRYAVLGPTFNNRYLVIVFQKKDKGKMRVITGWDMNDKEKRYYKTQGKVGRREESEVTKI